MKRRNYTPFEKLSYIGKGNRWIARLLCFCLVMTLLPDACYRFMVLAAEEEDTAQYEILSFSDLPEDVRVQTVNPETYLNELILPDMLTVSCNVADEEDQEESLLEPESTEETLAEALIIEELSTVLESTKELSEELESTKETSIGSESSEYMDIGVIVWVSSPEYDSNIEGTYTFTPVLPKRYTLTEGVVLPEILVTVEAQEESANQEGLYSDEKENLVQVLDGEPELGRISEDTTWDHSSLSDGTLIVEEGVTLTITSRVDITGNVTIEGGGTIKRGTSSAYFYANSTNASLTLRNITVDGNSDSVGSSSSMIDIRHGTLALDDGCTIKNCKSSGSGGAFYLEYGTAFLNKAVIINCSAYSGGAFYMRYSTVEINGTTILDCSSNSTGGAIYCMISTINILDATIENCSARYHSGAIGIDRIIDSSNNTSTLTIYNGIFRNNYTTSLIGNGYSHSGGGCIANFGGTLNIYGGSFIGNSTVGKGGCIYHDGYPDTYTNIYGGTFQANTAKLPGYEGSGAIYNSSSRTDSNLGNTELVLSGNVKFCGDGIEDSGVDGIYLDQNNGLPRKIWLSSTLTYPVTLYVAAKEGYVIAEGKEDYVLLHERDMKKISFVNIGNPNEKWYAVLDGENNQVKLSQIDPGYKLFVYYIGVDGKVTDDNQYEIGDNVTVKSGEELTQNGRIFLGWDTKEDGTGTRYKGGDVIKNIQEDINLYAIFSEPGTKTLTATFYSGEPSQKESRTVTVDEAAESGTVEAPELKDMTGWEEVGWSKEADQYDADYEAGDEITLTEDTSFYGIYQKNVTLSYDTNGGSRSLEPVTDRAYANVHEEITYQPAEFQVAEGISRNGYTFVEWNTEADGTGDSYNEGDVIESNEDIKLYAIYKKDLTATFYSGEPSQNETYTVTVDEATESGTVKAPELKDMTGWEKAGWSKKNDQYEIIDYEAGDEITLTEDTSYYGIYQKDVTLSYDANGGGGYTGI